ncbi:hypothetical protein N8T08_000336 [Aspergillus melleus]|uniref:Uncharacterized protein n=1 Tax=Aspergillus melleus TaxID=138277 RepID=A0ACC3BAW9_9EURO|nr:hypothetical protein N8T08_000336 [Aspergillus melleus]
MQGPSMFLHGSPILYYKLTWLRRSIMPRSVSGARARNIARVVDTVTGRIERRTDRKDFLYYILAATRTDKGMTRDEINVNAFSFSIAGSEATAAALAAFVFYICTHARVYRDSYVGDPKHIYG